MSKKIESPVKRWPGHLLLSDPLTYPQVTVFEEALDAAREYADQQGLDEEDIWTLKQRREYYYRLLPGLCACVQEWHLTNGDGSEMGHLNAETFPFSPFKSAMQLAAWLLGETVALFQEAEEVPNS